jgi:hypothetical protein
LPGSLPGRLLLLILSEEATGLFSNSERYCRIMRLFPGNLRTFERPDFSVRAFVSHFPPFYSFYANIYNASPPPKER